MTEAKPYRVIITKSRRLNIILANNSAKLRTYTHFVSIEDARRFAAILEKSLAEGPYFVVDRCPLCGRAYTRQNRLCLLKDGRIVHKSCFQKAVKRKEFSYSDCKEYWNSYFLQDAPAFNYNNLNDGGDRSPKFRYAIQTVSKAAVHLCLIESGGYMKHRFCLTYEECQGLICEIRLKSEQLQKYLDAVAGQCAFCKNSIYVDDHYYVMATGEVIHGICMERFIQSEASARVGFPARKILLPDTFEQECRFNESFIPFWHLKQV